MKPKKPFLIGVAVLAATVALTSQVALAGSLHSFQEKGTAIEGGVVNQSQLSPLMLARSNGPLSRSSDHFSHSSHSSHSSHYSSHQ